MIQYFEQFDKALLLKINGLHSPFFDELFYALTQTAASIPVFLLAAFLLYRKFGWKTMIFSIVVIACSIGLSDLISTECFKKVICRYRPTHNLEIGDLIHVVRDYRGGMYGFVSSHAANMFAFATAISLFLKRRNFTIFFFVWAVLVCYTRMYLGVHYPADIACGALLGSAVSIVCYGIANCLQKCISKV